MTVERASGEAIALRGDCGLEDAEALLRLLIETPQARVRWDECTGMHTAVLQVLLAGEAGMEGEPRGEFLNRHIAPLLMGTGDVS